MQSILHFDVQGTGQFIGEVSARGTVDEHLGRGQQRADLNGPLERNRRGVCPTCGIQRLGK
jgi:hypothetical protein